MKLSLNQNQSNIRDIEERLKSLKSKIETCNFNYYVLDEPSLSDHEYDSLVAELRKLGLQKAALKNQN